MQGFVTLSPLHLVTLSQMSPSRALIGLSVGSGFEAADAALVRVVGIGLAMTPTAAATARVPLPSDLRDAARRASRAGEPYPIDADRRFADALAVAARQVTATAGWDIRAVAAVGLLGQLIDAEPVDPADRIADQTGLTVVTRFRGRDVAVGGTGRPITPAADYLLFRADDEDRLLVHLGSVTSVVLLPAKGKVSEVVGFDTGPGHRLLDDITALGTRGREAFDPGGTKAVQGRCLDELLTKWRSHPFLGRKPPKALSPSAFGADFVADAFSVARQSGGSLHDLLCTATQFVARCVGDGVKQWLPAAKTGAPRRVLVSGGGVRNGFLWKLLAEQFPGAKFDRLDSVGIPPTGRSAACAAVLAALTLDGVAGNLPLLTRAAGGRLLGRIVPGDQRNWASCTAWMARRMGDYSNLGRAA
jgi:anhydro-N-acetylmuramic acid kinase